MTTVLNAYSVAFPAITNRIRASVFKEADTAIIAQIIDSTAGHPERIWTFAGLPRANYGFNLDEIDGSGNVVNNLAHFDVVPGQVDGTLVRNDEQIQADVTPGFTSGTNTFTFDGTSGKPDYRGWEIVVSEYGGRVPLINSIDFTWNKDTGVFLLVEPTDVIATGQWYNIHFDPIADPSAGSSYPSVNDFEIDLITANTTLIADSFGSKKILIEPSGTYLEVTLPDISTVPIGRPLMIEGGNTGGIWAAKFLKFGSDTIAFWHGDLFVLPNESLRIYRYKKPDLSSEWRIDSLDGNFKTVGFEAASDMVFNDIINAQLLDGSICDKNQYARIYNEIVLHLPSTQVVNYDDWLTGNNKYYFSLANSADPTFVDKFHFPDRRNAFARNNSGNKAGDFVAAQVGSFTDDIVLHTGDSFTGHPYDPTAVGKGLIANTPKDVIQHSVTFNSGKENYPQHYFINKYVLI